MPTAAGIGGSNKRKRNDVKSPDFNILVLGLVGGLIYFLFVSRIGKR